MATVWQTMKRLLLFGVLPLLVIGGVVAWFERDTLLTCYYLHRLEKAQGEEAAGWAEKLAALDEKVVADVLDLLGQQDVAVCANASIALGYLGKQWGYEDPRCVDLMNQAIKEFHRLSPCGQSAILRLALEWVETNASCPAGLACACGRLLSEVNHVACPELQDDAVQLALAVLARAKEANLHCAGRHLTQVALKSTNVSTRLGALRLAMLPSIDLRKDLVPLLSDSEPAIRRAAMRAVGEAVDVIQTDNLLPWLHDPDPEVRQLCEDALRGPKRKLRAEYLQLAKLITDPRWEVRVSVLDYLKHAEELEELKELDVGAWLRRLTHDPSPAVRAAAIRAASESFSVDLSDRLDQMAREDESSTVSELARHYLELRKDSPVSREP